MYFLIIQVHRHNQPFFLLSFEPRLVEADVVTSPVSSKESYVSVSPQNEAVSEMLSKPADFLCLQEVFDETASKPLVKLLSKK